MGKHFDTLHFARTMTGAGLKNEVSEALASAIAEIVMTDLATKTDVDRAVHQVVHQMTVRFGTMIAAAVAAIGVFSTLS